MGSHKTVKTWERKRYYESHKVEIIADWKSLPHPAFFKKWMSQATWMGTAKAIGFRWGVLIPISNKPPSAEPGVVEMAGRIPSSVTNSANILPERYVRNPRQRQPLPGQHPGKMVTLQNEAGYINFQVSVDFIKLSRADRDWLNDLLNSIESYPVTLKEKTNA